MSPPGTSLPNPAKSKPMKNLCKILLLIALGIALVVTLGGCATATYKTVKIDGKSYHVPQDVPHEAVRSVVTHESENLSDK